MTIQDVIDRRNIEFLVHFTRLENLDNILSKGIIPRNDMEDKFINPLASLLGNQNPKEKYIYNDNVRLDGKCDYSCLSIGFPNDLMFYRLRVDNPNAEWTVIGISTEVLLDHECLFYPCNAASNDVRYQNTENYRGVKAFDLMFQNDLSYPQDVQAEIMVKGVIKPKYIKGCAFSEKKYVDTYSEKFPKLKFLLHPDGKGFFGKREWTKIGY